MSEGGQQPSNLDLYLDGLLAGPELRAFEEQLARDPQLAAQVEAQRRIDDSLQRVMAAPPAPKAAGARTRTRRPSAASARGSCGSGRPCARSGVCRRRPRPD